MGDWGRAPVALDRLEVFAPLTRVVHAHGRVAPGSTERVPRMDIDISDESGRVLVRVRGLVFRLLEGRQQLAEPRTLVFEPVWTKAESGETSVARSYGRRIVVSCLKDAPDDAGAAAPGAEWHRLTSRYRKPGKRFTETATRLLETLRTVLESKPSQDVLLQVLIEGGEDGWALSGLAAMLATASLEDPRFVGQLIEVERDDRHVAGALAEAMRLGTGGRVRFADGSCFVRGLSEICCDEPNVGSPFKDGGVYLITGGAGGLGLVFAEQIARKTTGARIVLVGRSEPDDDRLGRLDAISALGAEVRFVRCDVADAASVARLLADIRAAHGRLDGVVHAAGVVNDRLIVNKQAGDLAAVLRPKVAGLVVLDEATAGETLDFFAVFSSVAGELGNVGQADYAAANAFADAYMVFRARRAARGERPGASLAIGWPLWADGGMRMDAETERAMRQRYGVAALETAAGVAAFDAALASGKHQVLVASGDAETIRLRMAASAREIMTAASDAETAPLTEDDAFVGRVQEHLRSLLSQVVGLPPERLMTEAPFEDYGIDSMMVVKLIGDLEKTVGPLPKTLFFEYREIRELSEYLAASHGTALSELFGAGAVDGSRTESVLTTRTGAPVLGRAGRRADAGIGHDEDLARRYPELVRLGRQQAGRPVFWVHGMNGTLQGLWPVADRVRRPFLGIEPRGRTTDRKPLKGSRRWPRITARSSSRCSRRAPTTSVGCPWAA